MTAKDQSACQGLLRSKEEQATAQSSSLQVPEQGALSHVLCGRCCHFPFSLLRSFRAWDSLQIL